MFPRLGAHTVHNFQAPPTGRLLVCRAGRALFLLALHTSRGLSVPTLIIVPSQSGCPLEPMGMLDMAWIYIYIIP